MSKPNTISINKIGKGEPLILLHGWSWHAGIWQPVAAKLAEDFEVYLVDLPGHGWSTACPANYTCSELTDLILPHLPDQAHWLGWSLGGLLALWVAVHHPNRINRLVSVASTPRFTEAVNWPGLNLAILAQFGQALREQTQATLLEFLALQLRGSREQASHYETLRTQLIETPMPQLTALMGGLELLRSIDLRAEFLSLNIPSLHIYGQLDALVPARTVDLLKQQKPSAMFTVFERCGHIPFLHAPLRFCEVVREFLV